MLAPLSRQTAGGSTARSTLELFRYRTGVDAPSAGSRLVREAPGADEAEAIIRQCNERPESVTIV